MNHQRFLTSTCRCCHYYQPEGRRGGMCQQLGAPVKGCWEACSLAAHPFIAQKTIEDDIVYLEHSLTLSSDEAVEAEPVAEPISEPISNLAPSRG
ncbi:hypothetical protein PN462_00380 [Spirulina sp. CS-785/01]|uniref:hypothetical protein n=1 Tax=Spirulina sp. CS-785/01 TaxID=3021716 RepID=UPI00232CD284|nr:hypothetical protein [Spirulina sp. CS-785/01]MDB9311537.1 hypothetical protein [Spirulina sp. CS-785/01]